MIFERIPDQRTEQCEHDEADGCWRCCNYCDHILHRCGGCGKVMTHSRCGHARLGTCSKCREDQD